MNNSWNQIESRSNIILPICVDFNEASLETKNTHIFSVHSVTSKSEERYLLKVLSYCDGMRVSQ